MSELVIPIPDELVMQLADRVQAELERRGVNSTRHPAPSRWLTVAETAAALGVEHKAVRRLIHEGQLPAIRVGRVLRVREDDLADRLAYQPGDQLRRARRARSPRPSGSFSKMARRP